MEKKNNQQKQSKPKTFQEYLDKFKKEYRHNPRKNPRPPLGLWVTVKKKGDKQK